MDHSDLIRELPQIERMTNQERLKLAHSRRKNQLKSWTQYEKALTGGKGSKHFQDSFKNKTLVNGNMSRSNPKVKFTSSVMLLEAAGRNDVAEVRRLLECGISPDVANEDGLTALHQCCIDDNEEMMRLLFDFGVNVNAEDSEKWTPLHASATCGNLQIVQQLIARGANLLGVNAEGNMPYDICDDEATLDFIESEMAKRGVTQELIEEIRSLPETRMLQDMHRIQAEGGDLEYRDHRDGATYLHIAAANGYLKVVEFLLDNHVSIDAQDNDYWQPIHACAIWNHIDVLELLCQHGANLYARTKNNETPFEMSEDPEMKNRILELRSEQESLKNAAVKKVRRSQSSNSRTHSIRRTSHREKGLTSKRDVAEEVQKRLIIADIETKDRSPSPPSEFPYSDVNETRPGKTAIPDLIPVHGDRDSNSSGEDDKIFKSLSPALMMGRDSVTQLHSSDDAGLNKRVSKRGSKISTNGDLESRSSNGSVSSRGKQTFNNPIAISSHNNNMFASPGGNLPTPEINPSVELQPHISSPGSAGRNGLRMSGSNDTLNGGNNTFDIRVQVTINTNQSSASPPSQTPAQMSTFGSHHAVTNSINTLYSPPGTLADLKKQRSLHYVNVNRPNSQFSILDAADLPPKYELPPSPSLAPKRFTGNPGEIIGDYQENRRKCCVLM